MQEYKENIFYEFEKSNQLFDSELGGLPIWEFIRFSIYSLIRRSDKVNRLSTSNKSLSTNIAGSISAIRNLFISNPFHTNQTFDLLVINHPRRKLTHSKDYFEDIYTDCLLEKLDSNTSFIVWECFMSMKHNKPVKTKNLKYLDYLEYSISLKALIGEKFKFGITKDEYKQISELSKLICDHFGINRRKLEKVIIKEVIFSKLFLKQALILLRSVNPKKILMVVSYSIIPKVITFAAKQLNIPVYELQHGTLGELNINYKHTFS